ncbi:MAG: site-2 protease family protein [Actinomycetota bacterium]|nr:site-2 protease family protein [Actinomycetota bacterium]
MTDTDTKEPINRTSAPVQRRGGVSGTGIPLGRWRGVPISARWSVLVALAVFADVLATSALPTSRPGHATATYWLAGLLTATIFLITLLAHEFAHALTARHFRIGVRGITLWLLGGFTELDGESPSPRAEVLVAAAGPATSIGLGAMSGALAWATGSGLLSAALSWLAGISILLGVFNLLPGAPLDGGRVLRGLLWMRYKDRARAARATSQAGRVLGFVLVGLGFVEFFATGSFAGLWIAIVGWFIVGGATVEGQLAQVEGLRGVHVADVMSLSPPALPEWWTVEQADHAALGASDVFPLVDFGGQATGAITLRDLQRVPLAQRGEIRLRDLVRGRRLKPLVIRPESLLTEIALSLRRSGSVAVVVDEINRPIGLLTTADLSRATQLSRSSQSV